MAGTTKIDIDKALNIYNSKNEPLNKQQFIEMFNLNRVTKRNWKLGKVPKVLEIVHAIADMCDCDIKEFTTIKNIKK